MPLEDIRNERIKKAEILKNKGFDPYPASVSRTHLVEEVLDKFGAFVKSGKKAAVVGRIVSKREHGGSTFADLCDASGKIQLYFKRDILGEGYVLFTNTADIGDFLEIEGRCFKTKKGEKTIEVLAWRMLAKSLRPLPEKWHGLQDVEERFRKRYLDLLMNEEVRVRFETRSKIIFSIRRWMEDNGFLEVETPMLHSIPGGALAKPFKTHHHALDLDLYLRIAPELYLKRLLVGGFEKIFEMGKNFRNEGIDATHNPEFTMLECYAAYWDEEAMMKFVEDLFLSLAKIYKRGEGAGGKKFAWKKPFSRITFADLLSRYAQIHDYHSQSREAVAARAKQLGIEIAPHYSKGKIADEIYKKICRPYLIQPTFVTNHPYEISPLAKANLNLTPVRGVESWSESAETRRFQLIIGGMELANGFAELNDPLEQRKRFEAQEKEREGGEEEAQRMDEDYIEALEYGMPPAAGLGVGIDRVVMLFTDAKNIREVLLFPTMRPK